MITYIATGIVLVIGLIAIEVKKSYHSLPGKELKYRATQGDELASQLYKAAAYGPTLELLLWLIIIFSTTGSFFLISSFAPVWISFIAIVLLLWLAFAWVPSSGISKTSSIIVKYAAPIFAWILNYLHPVLKHLLFISSKGLDSAKHSRIYDQKDLISLLNRQKDQEDNRINPEQLAIIRRCLDLPLMKVTDISKPWSKVKTITDEEAIGPILLDELHKSEQQFIPVKSKSEPKKIVGLLDMSKLDISSQGKVAFYMDRVVYYLNEDDTLDVALHAFGQTNYPVFIIVDERSKLIGLLSFNNLIDQIISSQPGLNFAEYASLDAVAQKYKAKDSEESTEAELLS